MCRPRALVATACRLQIAAPSPSPLLRVALVDDVAFYRISDGLAEKKYRRASLRDSFALRKPRPPFIHCSGLRELNNLWSIVTLGLETERAEPPQPDGGI